MNAFTQFQNAEHRKLRRQMGIKGKKHLCQYKCITMIFCVLLCIKFRDAHHDVYPIPGCRILFMYTTQVDKN